jgi:threonine dehydratase
MWGYLIFLRTLMDPLPHTMQSSHDRQVPEYRDVLAAHERIRAFIRHTPVLENAALSAELGCHLICKCENLQDIGAFKIRGAMNAVLCLRARGNSADVATHSSGNHGAAVAAAARLDGRRAVVVMPENSVAAKVENVRKQGGRVVFCEANQSAREQGLQRLVDEGLEPIHPYDQHEVICGQGTCALELLEQAPDLDVLLAPVGGGGLIAGCSVVARQIRPELTVIAAEPAGAADTAESFRRGARVTSWQPETLADGLRALVGQLPFDIIRNQVDAVLTVSEEGLLAGMDLVWRHLNLLIEPSSAVVIAAILEHPEQFAGRRVGAILTGGNADLERFPQFTRTPKS